MTCTSELVRGILIENAGIAGIGTAVDMDSLFASGFAYDFNEITAFNDGDGPVRVAWTNDATGNMEDFIVPEGGKSFTRILNKGNITKASLKVYAISDITAVTGNITINLGQH